jgi:hypothetical protein
VLLTFALVFSPLRFSTIFSHKWIRDLRARLSSSSKQWRFVHFYTIKRCV